MAPYVTVSGLRSFDLEAFNKSEKEFLREAFRRYRSHLATQASELPHLLFKNWWMPALDEAIEAHLIENEGAVRRICQDLEERLGIANHDLPLPSVRACIVDLIEQAFGTRYRFCQERGVSEGYLSRVLRGDTQPTLKSLENILEKLQAVLVVRPRNEVMAQTSIDPSNQAAILTIERRHHGKKEVARQKDVKENRRRERKEGLAHEAAARFADRSRSTDA